MTRYRSYDWINEIDPVMSIECLSKVPPKPRLTPGRYLERIRPDGGDAGGGAASCSTGCRTR